MAGKWKIPLTLTVYLEKRQYVGDFILRIPEKNFCSLSVLCVDFYERIKIAFPAFGTFLV